MRGREEGSGKLKEGRGMGRLRDREGKRERGKTEQRSGDSDKKTNRKRAHVRIVFTCRRPLCVFPPHPDNTEFDIEHINTRNAARA